MPYTETQCTLSSDEEGIKINEKATRKNKKKALKRK